MEAATTASAPATDDTAQPAPNCYHAAPSRLIQTTPPLKQKDGRESLFCKCGNTL